MSNISILLIRSFRGDGGNAARRVNARSGSISSNNHGLLHAHDTFCQKRHSYAFQDDKMVRTVKKGIYSKIHIIYNNPIL